MFCARFACLSSAGNNLGLNAAGVCKSWPCSDDIHLWEVITVRCFNHTQVSSHERSF